MVMNKAGCDCKVCVVPSHVVVDDCSVDLAASAPTQRSTVPTFSSKFSRGLAAISRSAPHRAASVRQNIGAAIDQSLCHARDVVSRDATSGMMGVRSIVKSVVAHPDFLALMRLVGLGAVLYGVSRTSLTVSPSVLLCGFAACLSIQSRSQRARDVDRGNRITPVLDSGILVS